MTMATSTSTTAILGEQKFAISKVLPKSGRAIWQQIYHHSFFPLMKGQRRSQQGAFIRPPNRILSNSRPSVRPDNRSPHGTKFRSARVSCVRPMLDWHRLPWPGQRGMFIYKLSMFWLHVDRINIIQDVIATTRPPRGVQRGRGVEGGHRMVSP